MVELLIKGGTLLVIFCENAIRQQRLVHRVDVLADKYFLPETSLDIEAICRIQVKSIGKSRPGFTREAQNLTRT
jgi:hypothetical protein